jgi:A/G-specific adenine glycosylase
VTPHRPSIAPIVSRLLEWYLKNARDLPWRREPYCNDPYAVHVSEVMLQQTQVKTVIPYWTRWLVRLPDIAALAHADPDLIHKLWEGLGYYSRARNLQRAAQEVLRRHEGKFPTRYEDVLELPGVGPYTAGAICSIVFNQARPILDGNVIRVLARLHGIRANVRTAATRQKLWKLATELVEAAPEAPGHLNQALMELGAIVCIPKSPRCGECPARNLCTGYLKGIADRLPNLGLRVQATPRKFFAFVVERKGKYLVRQRSADQVNAHLWEFPNIEAASGISSPDNAAVALGLTLAEAGGPRMTVKHTITRFRITVEIYDAVVAGTDASGVWASKADLQRLAFPSAHRRIANALLGKQEGD